ncbi:50S ribosomal protein L20 [Candidatus Amesbacteria bacterium RIFOXYB1_FULL_44_23]|uniref:Large ribosomal subunit protein bL20 n=1 Tax=Candidatus Amesbacteria bacterium RIFOXYB1_FULL_44_23 TaxID=1797263 RepID=A0A1F4ZVZ1_9BACT|nr:MAG: 50S ribosomal protein L20 [Candidatus Amesbacteria bacterium RIFOXYB1_FULL_44_23]
MRVKSPRRQRHNKVLKLAQGYRMARHRLYKAAHESVVHAGQYAFMGRKLRKRDFRALWIVRINAALSSLGVTYHLFISALKKSSIQLDRKILSELASNQPQVFKKIVETAGFKLQK